MDMIFRDDECRIRTDHAPANFTTIKHMALNLTKSDSRLAAASGGGRIACGTG
jgi:predicted transposase YbfD/YdcC